MMYDDVSGVYVKRDEPSAVEQFIKGEQYRNHAFGHMVLVYYAVEAWLRAWMRIVRA